MRTVRPSLVEWPWRPDPWRRLRPRWRRRTRRRPWPAAGRRPWGPGGRPAWCSRHRWPSHCPRNPSKGNSQQWPILYPYYILPWRIPQSSRMERNHGGASENVAYSVKKSYICLNLTFQSYRGEIFCLILLLSCNNKNFSLIYIINTYCMQLDGEALSILHTFQGSFYWLFFFNDWLRKTGWNSPLRGLTSSSLLTKPFLVIINNLVNVM